MKQRSKSKCHLSFCISCFVAERLCRFSKLSFQVACDLQSLHSCSAPLLMPISGQSCKQAGRRIQTLSCPQRSLDYQVQPLKQRPSSAVHKHSQCSPVKPLSSYTSSTACVSLHVPWSAHRALLTMTVTTCMDMLVQESSPCFSTQSQPAPTTKAASIHFEEDTVEDKLISFIQVDQARPML